MDMGRGLTPEPLRRLPLDGVEDFFIEAVLISADEGEVEGEICDDSGEDLPPLLPGIITVDDFEDAGGRGGSGLLDDGRGGALLS